MSHALLIAVLMNNGGSVELPRGAFDADALGAVDGSWHSVEMKPDPVSGSIRLSVRPGSTVPGGGLLVITDE
ncbi:hypothetical protein [Streptomyces sp. NPDC047973]|uniref:hypothetical protein n=1 Tax=Streptomyces sp. NPDC047973 TaxID=3155383 RepID=UPI00343D75CC